MARTPQQIDSDNYYNSTYDTSILCYPDEEWRDIGITSGQYQVSNLGRVRRMFCNSNPHNGNGITVSNKVRICRGSADEEGYRSVDLYKWGHHRIHRLVCEEFIGLSPAGLCQVDHIDGIKWHNELANLEWVSSRTNMQRARDNGLLHLNLSGLDKGRYRCKHVQCIDTGQVFDSLKCAGQFGLCTPEAIAYSINHSSICRGHRYRFLTEEEYNELRSDKSV